RSNIWMAQQAWAGYKIRYSRMGRPETRFSKPLKKLAPQVGLEPTTLRLTAGCSAIELLRSGDWPRGTRRDVILSIFVTGSLVKGETPSRSSARPNSERA